MSAAALSGSVPILAFLVSVISAGLSYVVAGSKGHNPIVWLVVGFFLGPLGLIAAAGLADRKNHLLHWWQTRLLLKPYLFSTPRRWQVFLAAL